ncbi:(2Fe-2S)-binding protein [Hoeflea alexandrii]|uniref:(2Fe-2S)-binding protein n=1 Tax=Hoeflea alexandrii TaxID=288436 RepID=UPI0022AFB57D|nr:(2Fe-2S)-binding protein [Hoeflea alexandrii]MCZ4289302.1 (2Fe-2S)-binding protein [Hoeflea alexandrii]
MKPDSPFREIDPETDRVTVRFGSSELSLPRGENLAGALLVAGVMPFRHTPLSGAPRGPFCMMGACYDCLVEIDGINRQACMLQVTEGLQIERPSINRAIKGAGNA